MKRKYTYFLAGGAVLAALIFAQVPAPSEKMNPEETSAIQDQLSIIQTRINTFTTDREAVRNAKESIDLTLPKEQIAQTQDYYKLTEDTLNDRLRLLALQKSNYEAMLSGKEQNLFEEEQVTKEVLENDRDRLAKVKSYLSNPQFSANAERLAANIEHNIQENEEVLKNWFGQN